MWNYRIITDKESYGIFEVIYNDDGKICAHTEEPEVVGDSIEDLIKNIESHLNKAKEGNLVSKKISEEEEDLVLTFELMLSDAKKYKDKVLEHHNIDFAPCAEDFDEGEGVVFEDFDISDIFKK
jgi:hypothetical protein